MHICQKEHQQKLYLNRQNHKGNTVYIEILLHGKYGVVVQPAIHNGFVGKNKLPAKEDNVGEFFTDRRNKLVDLVYNICSNRKICLGIMTVILHVIDILGGFVADKTA